MSGDHYSDDYRHGFTNGHAAGRQAAYDGEEPRGYGQALRDMTARALAAEAALADAEARGRAHGLLAACMWTLGEKESYENHPHRRAIPTLKWDAFDRGRWLGIVNGLDALERLDPTPRPPSETVFMEASRDE